MNPVKAPIILSDTFPKHSFRGTVYESGRYVPPRGPATAYFSNAKDLVRNLGPFVRTVRLGFRSGQRDTIARRRWLKLGRSRSLFSAAGFRLIKCPDAWAFDGAAEWPEEIFDAPFQEVKVGGSLKKKKTLIDRMFHFF